MFLQTKSIWADKSVSDLENGKYSVLITDVSNATDVELSWIKTYASTSTSPSLIRDGLSLGVVLR
jgi:hypothetical protein